MGCSSSALGKAGDSSRLRSATSNECFSTTEESGSCVAQPKPRVPAGEPALCGHAQRAGLPPAEKPKASVMPTANGVGAGRARPVAKDAAATEDAGHQSGPTEQPQPPEGPEEAEPRQLEGKDDTPGALEAKKDQETGLEIQSLKGSAETEPSGTAAPGQPSRAAGAGEATPGAPARATGLMKPAGPAEGSPPPETAGALPAQEALGEGERSPLPETTPKENRSPEIGNQWVDTVEEQQPQEAAGRGEWAQSQLPETVPQKHELPETLEGSQFVQTVEEPQLQETLERDAQPQPQPLEIIPKEDGTPEIQETHRPVLTPAMEDPSQATPQGPRTPQQVRQEGRAGGREHPVGISEMATPTEVGGESHTGEDQRCPEGETGEKGETDTENKVIEEAETKEEETGEAVGLSAAT